MRVCGLGVVWLEWEVDEKIGERRGDRRTIGLDYSERERDFGTWRSVTAKASVGSTLEWMKKDRKKWIHCHRLGGGYDVT